MISEKSENKGAAQAGVDARTFGSALGQAVWLMTMDERYRDLPIREIERLVATPVFLGQFKLYSKGKSPVAFLSWASVSDAVKARIDAGDTALELKDWRSGSEVVDCISPLMDPQMFIDQFMAEVNEARGK